MRNIRLSLLALLVGAFAAPLSAQQIGQMTRVTPTTGLADSTLFACTDSTKVFARACKFSDIQKRLAFKTFDSLVTGNIRITGACTGCGGAVVVSDTVRTVIFDSVRTVRLRADTIRSQAGASKRLVLQTTTSGSALTTALRFNEAQQSLFADGVAARPGFAFAADSTLGWYRAGTNSMRASVNGTQTFGITTGTVSIIGSAVLKLGAGTAGAPDLTWATAPTMGLYSFGIDTIGVATAGVHSVRISGGAAPTIAGGAGNMTLIAGTGNSRTMTLQTTTSAGAATTFLRGNEVQQTLATNRTAGAALAFVSDTTTGFNIAGGQTGHLGIWARDKLVATFDTSTSNGAQQGFNLQNNTVINASTGSAALPAFYFSGSPTSGFYRFGADTIGIATSAAASLGIRGGASPTIFGGTGNMTLLAGTGANRTLTLQSSNNSSVATSFLAGAGDTVKFSGHAIAASFTAAAGTPGTLCYNTATNEITKNNATSCVVSSLRFKTDVNTISREWASDKLMALRASSFTYKDGGRHALGLIAENADSVDSRLGFRNPDGTVNSFDQPGVLALLVATVQRQQLQIDSLRAEIHPRRKP